ncbi:hypothetical protein [Anaerosinus massiliensis]|uniref:hypothetical protein n=1 Tax=Massilibacillus massiliensis TaxID=1806837 RepID=UPI000DA61667|nr:hypothetical protein [Massilibacillus massiliensis]
MNKKIFAVLAIFVLVIVAGCGNSVKSDLDEYMKFQQTSSAEAGPIIADFNSKASQIMSNRQSMNSKEEKLAALNDVVQKFTTIADKQKAYKPKTKEVQDLHDKAIKQMDMTLEELNKIIQAVQTDSFDQSTLDDINKKRQELQQVAKEYNDDLKVLQEKYK